MAHRRELTRPRSERPKITVASVQTIVRRLDAIPRDAFKIVVVDEAHHATADSYTRILEHFDTWVLGVTATPDRSDRRGLGEVFDSVAFEYDVQNAIADGWLCPIRSFLVKTEADFSQARKIAGELATRDVERILTKEPHLIEVAHPIVHERKDRPAMVFAASVAHAHALSRVLCAVTGDPLFAAAVDGTVAFDLRHEVIERFRAGTTKALVNCALFTEGFDVPEIALVAIARPILSRSFYAQMVGRGTRIAQGKDDLLVLDFVPANCRHSLVHAVDIFADDDEHVLERARSIAAERSAEGEALLLEQALELARQEVEADGASVVYSLVPRDPFAAVGIDVDAMIAERRPGKPPSERQTEYLRKAGLPTDRIAQLTSFQAEDLAEQLASGSGRSLHAQASAPARGVRRRGAGHVSRRSP